MQSAIFCNILYIAGEFAVLGAYLRCLHHLNDAAIPWNYVQIYSGEDVPIRTNMELVNVFQVLNGAIGFSHFFHDRKRALLGIPQKDFYVNIK